MTDVIVLYTTWPDNETAAEAAHAAVACGLAACVNALSPLRATHRWEGRIETAEEVPVLFKTRGELALRLRDWIVARHPYDTPAVLSFAAGPASLPAYLAWVEGETGRPDALETPHPAASARATMKRPSR